MSGSHDAPEVAVFKLFARAAKLPVLFDSVEKRPTPEPDVRCQIQGVGVVAFEVTEAIDPVFARQLGNQENLKAWFYDGLRSLPVAARQDLTLRLKDAIVHVEFHKEASLETRRRAIPIVLDRLRTIGVEVHGELVVRDWGLPSCVTWLRISRGGFSGPIFDTSRAVPVDNQLIPRLRKKFRKSLRYRTDARRIDLLVYERLSMPWAGEWVPRVTAVLREEMPSSRFAKVWVFDASAEAILIEYPLSPVDGASRRAD